MLLTHVQTQHSVRGNEAPHCFCTISFYFELAMHVKTVTTLSLLGVFLKPAKRDCALYPVLALDCSRWTGQAAVTGSFNSQWTPLETAREKVFDSGTLNWPGEETDALSPTEGSRLHRLASKQPLLLSLWQGGRLGIPFQYPKHVSIIKIRPVVLVSVGWTGGCRTKI